MIEHPMGCYELERFGGDREKMLAEVMSVFQPSPWQDSVRALKEVKNRSAVTKS
jgi:hypothetical protein